MNWYKESQQFMTERPYKRRTGDMETPGYLEIGHNEFDQFNKNKETNEPDIVWAWKEGRIIEIEGKGKSSHHDFQNLEQYRGMAVYDLYRGRYENKNGVKRVSVLPPYSQEYRPIPNQLIKSLVRRFGNDIEIHSYADGQ